MREGSLLFPVFVLIGIKEPFCGRRGTTSNSPRHMTTMVLPINLHRELSLKISLCIVHKAGCLRASHVRRHEVSGRDVCSHEGLQAARRRGVF